MSRRVYIKKIIARDRRRTIVMIRTGCLGLAVETGRYRSPKTPRSDRKCQACTTDCVEDEVHFIAACPAFKEERNHLFRETSCFVSNFYSMNVLDKTTEILRLCGYNLEIGKIIHGMYKKRSSVICM